MISVVVAAYNAEKTIKKCITSILNQTYKDFEVVIIDDGSKDKTAEIIDNYKNNKKIKIIHQENHGIAQVRNLALEMVTGNYITFVDSDDYVDENFLFDLLQGYNDKLVNIGLSIVGVRRLKKDGEIIEIDAYKEGIYNRDKLLSYILSFKGPQGYLCNKLWRMDIIRKYNIKVDNSLFMAEDLDFCVSYIAHINYGFVSSKADYNYVQYPTSASNSIILGNLSNTPTRVIETHKNFILALKKITKKIDKENADAFTVAEERLYLVYLNFLRSLMMLDDSNRELKKKLRKKILKNFDKILKSNMPLKTKIAFILIKINPKLLYKLDKKRFRRKIK